jgi:uncharacterized protein YndB with AHSA1/START domain
MEPIRAEVTVPAEPQAAFTAFTAQMTEWWDPLLTPDSATYEGISIDPDGPVETVHSDGEHYTWGRVTSWTPPDSYTQDFWLGHSEEDPTTLTVTFTEVEDGTRVAVEHGGWTEATAGVREKYTHWPDLLERYAAHVIR